MLIKFGAIITDGCGTIGGHFISRNAYGRFQGTKVTPTNPQTSFQQLMRGYFGNASQAWRTLSNEQRASWADYGLSQLRGNCVGDEYDLTGFNAFMYINQNAQIVGQAIQLDVPASVPLDALPPFTVTVSQVAGVCNALTLTFDNPQPANNPYMLIFASRSLSAGINYVKSAYRLIAVTDVSTWNAPDFRVEYILKYPGASLVAGEKVFIKCHLIEATSFTSGLIVQASGIIT